MGQFGSKGGLKRIAPVKGHVREHCIVALTADRPDCDWRAGDTGTVIHLYEKSDVVEVEFTDAEHSDVIAVHCKDLRVLF